MSERWGDSARDRQELDRWITRDDDGCFVLPPGWILQDESTLICPCGTVIEWDGECSNGCVSPLREAGLI